MFEKQRDNVGVTLLRRLVEGSVTHLHTVIDLFITDPFMTDQNKMKFISHNLKFTKSNKHEMELLLLAKRSEVKGEEQEPLPSLYMGENDLKWRETRALTN